MKFYACYNELKLNGFNEIPTINCTEAQLAFFQGGAGSRRVPKGRVCGGWGSRGRGVPFPWVENF